MIEQSISRLRRVYSGENPREVYAPGLGAGATNAALAAQAVREGLPRDQAILSREFIKRCDDKQSTKDLAKQIVDSLPIASSAYDAAQVDGWQPMYDRVEALLVAANKRKATPTAKFLGNPNITRYG